MSAPRQVTLPVRTASTRVSAANLRRWRVRLAGWLIHREVEREFRRDGRDITIELSRSITVKLGSQDDY